MNSPRNLLIKIICAGLLLIIILFVVTIYAIWPSVLDEKFGNEFQRLPTVIPAWLTMPLSEDTELQYNYSVNQNFRNMNTSAKN